MESWAEKYRPKNLSEIIGNTKIINELKSWASSWGEKMTKKGVILSGPPGCGKTSAAIALANEMGLNYYPMLIGMSPFSPIEGYRFFISKKEDSLI